MIVVDSATVRVPSSSSGNCRGGHSAASLAKPSASAMTSGVNGIAFSYSAISTF